MNLSSKLLSIWLLLAFFFLAPGCNRERPRIVEVTTDKGEFTIRLYEETEKYRKNFVRLVKDGFYDSLLFHRVIPDVIIQGGDPDSRTAAPGKYLGKGNVDYTIDPDFRYVHTYGAVSGARTPDEVNPQKKSSGSQFFIVIGHPVTDQDLNKIEKEKGMRYTPEQRRLYKLVGGIPQFDQEYTVFGEVVKGMDVVKQISRVPRDANDRPSEDVRMFMKIAEKNNEE